VSGVRAYAAPSWDRPAERTRHHPAADGGLPAVRRSDLHDWLRGVHAHHRPVVQSTKYTDAITNRGSGDMPASRPGRYLIGACSADGYAASSTVSRLGHGSSGSRAGRPGHHSRGPMSTASVGMSSVRTTVVSSRTPIATISPMWKAITTGSTTSVANVAASTTPALVMTPPVTVSAESIPSRLPTF